MECSLLPSLTTYIFCRCRPVTGLKELQSLLSQWVRQSSGKLENNCIILNLKPWTLWPLVAQIFTLSQILLCMWSAPLTDAGWILICHSGITLTKFAGVLVLYFSRSEIFEVRKHKHSSPSLLFSSHFSCAVSPLKVQDVHSDHSEVYKELVSVPSWRCWKWLHIKLTQILVAFLGLSIYIYKEIWLCIVDLDLDTCYVYLITVVTYECRLCFILIDKLKFCTNMWIIESTSEPLRVNFGPIYVENVCFSYIVLFLVYHV